MDLLLKDGLAFLLAVGAKLCWDMCRVECRNAALKRLMRVLGMTWGANIMHVSGDFVLMRNRAVENLFRTFMPGGKKATIEGASAKEKKQRARRRGKYAGKRTGGGGAQRRSVGQWVKRRAEFGHSFATADTRKATLAWANAQAEAERNQGGERWNDVVQEGRAGTLSYRNGGNAFQAPVRSAKRQRIAEERYRTAFPPSCSIADSMRLAIATNALAIVTENLQAKQQAQERQQAEDKKAVLEWSAENQPRLAAAVPALQELSQSTPMFHPDPSGAKSDQGQDLTHKTHVCNLFT